ncbi:hypothetical protein BD410DRAFT_214115 [Rickenella mellea]|uniref:Uncharacterized protein n=1 Tax=Rickenella mellea TaxID=50990 RepID=A0A4Y7QM16_9AGAM|nr:hypothetical protein BD410DRAFT_214115 [Rickenella mellea]
MLMSGSGAGYYYSNRGASAASGRGADRQRRVCRGRIGHLCSCRGRTYKNLKKGEHDRMRKRSRVGGEKDELVRGRRYTVVIDRRSSPRPTAIHTTAHICANPKACIPFHTTNTVTRRWRGRQRHQWLEIQRRCERRHQHQHRRCGHGRRGGRGYGGICVCADPA